MKLRVEEAKAGAAIVAWYASNTGVLLLNKQLLANHGFGAPIFLTVAHMGACAVLTYLSHLAGLVKLGEIHSKQQGFKVVVLALVFAVSVAAGNASLRFIPVSFNQAIGATTPFFTAVFSACLQRRLESLETYGALVPVVAGVILASRFEPLFSLAGFLACLSATAARALKSVLQDALLSSESERLDSMSLLFYMAPAALVFLLPLSFALEPEAFAQAKSLTISRPSFSPLLALNASTAFLANLSNFLVTRVTSALTLQVLGNAKGAFAAFVSILVFRNPVSFTSLGGYGITLAGVFAYSAAKQRSSRAKASKSHSASRSS